jgi:hypothetical protein
MIHLMRVTTFRNAFFSLLLLLCVVALSAPIAASPIDPSEYDGPSPGARPRGLGSCGIGLKDEPFSSFYNPAALCFMQNSMVVFDFHYAQGTEELELANTGAFSIDFLAMLNQAGGLSWHPLTRNTFEHDTSYFSPAHNDTVQVNTRYEYRADEVYTTMTTLVTEQFEVLSRKPLLGINLKYFRAQCAEARLVKTDSALVDATSNIDTGNGFGIDLGFAYATEWLIFGLSVKDAFSRIYWNDYDTDKVGIKTGAGICSPITSRVTLSSDIRYNWESRITGSCAGLEMNLIREKKPPKTKHHPIGEPESAEKSAQGSIVRIGIDIHDLSNREERVYSLGYSYLYSRFRIDIALMGEQERIKEGDFSSQVSLLILY